MTLTRRWSDNGGASHRAKPREAHCRAFFVFAPSCPSCSSWFILTVRSCVSSDQETGGNHEEHEGHKEGGGGAPWPSKRPTGGVGDNLEGSVTTGDRTALQPCPNVGPFQARIAVLSPADPQRPSARVAPTGGSRQRRRQAEMQTLLTACSQLFDARPLVSPERVLLNLSGPLARLGQVGRNGGHGNCLARTRRAVDS
jgi:hypothetical protein